MCRKVGNAIKHGVLQNSNLFESFGFRYFGRINGNDVKALVRTLSALKDIRSPKLLHVLTTKGHGYSPAEQDLPVWHAPGKFNPDTGERIESVSDKDRYQDVFGQTLLDLAVKDARVVGVTPAMPTGCSMNIMMAQMPERCFDVGIAEAHAVTFSAGLAADGHTPFCNIYSTFMQRAYDNIIHDVALQQLPVVLCLDRGGIVGEDGATHHGVFDLAYLSCIPNMVVAAPSNELQLRNLMYTALEYGKPFAIRYPRGYGMGIEWKEKEFEAMAIGKGLQLSDGDDVAILAIGKTTSFAIEAAKGAAEAGVSVAVYDLIFAKPLDTELIIEVGKRFKRVITVEDGVIRGGVGEAVTKVLADNGLYPQITTLGIADKFIEQGTPNELYSLCGYDKNGILETILQKK